MEHFSLSLPFTDPVLVFATVMVVILVSPLVFARFNIPGIVGLILSGVILGPHGLNVLARDQSIVLFGTVGLLYLMFMAGLEMDMAEFKINKYKSFVFGTLTFVAPFILGFFASLYVLKYSMMASVLFASMFSTHTLISYPLVGRLGITQTRTMPVIIGGTIITDALVLLILAVITNLQANEVSGMFFVKLLSLLAAMTFVILWGVPRLGRWFFRNLETEGHSQYLFVLAIVFLSGFLAHLIGVEPIIGAFLAGLALNQLIPNTSTLMNRIEFAGQALFIPFFLISVGMLVDFRVLLKGPEALFVAALIIVISFTGKWIASFAVQQIFRYRKEERTFIWGMSSSHAAATIAVVIIGYNLKLLDENALNGTILLILTSCLGSSVITERAGRKIALQDKSEISQKTDKEERILVPVANLENVSRLIDLALIVKNPSSHEPLYPLYVVQNKQQAKTQITQYEDKIFHALKDSAIEIRKEPVFRIDVNVPNGILRAVNELRITDVIIGWNGKTSNDRFGPVLDSVIDNTVTQLLICKLVQPVNTIRRIIVAVPENAEKEVGFPGWIDTIFQLSRIAGTSLEFYCSGLTASAVVAGRPDKTSEVKFNPLQKWNDLYALQKEIDTHDILITVLSRKHTISYHPAMDKVGTLLSRYFFESNMIVLFPGLIAARTGG